MQLSQIFLKIPGDQGPNFQTIFQVEITNIPSYFEQVQDYLLSFFLVVAELVHPERLSVSHL